MGEAEVKRDSNMAIGICIVVLLLSFIPSHVTVASRFLYVAAAVAQILAVVYSFVKLGFSDARDNRWLIPLGIVFIHSFVFGASISELFKL